MAIGYERINTSAARGKKRRADEIPARNIVVTNAGALLWHPIYGNGVLSESFVSDCDKALCLFDSGYEVVLRGGAIRGTIRDRANGIGQ